MRHVIAGFCALWLGASGAQAGETMELDPDWEYVADTVMGGVSTGEVSATTIDGRAAAQLTGQVSLENNGGFVQMAFDLQTGGGVMDASGYTGIALDVIGNGQEYDLRLRTDALTRPWQSFRTDFVAPDQWTTIRIPFAQISAHKTDAAFDPARLRRIGVLAIGREFQAEVAVAGIRFYR